MAHQSICSANSNENILLHRPGHFQVNQFMEPAGSNVGARSRAKRAAQPRRERAAGAKVDLGILPRMLGYNLRRAHQLSWRTYVSFIGESKIWPGLFSLLVLTRSNPGI